MNTNKIISMLLITPTIKAFDVTDFGKLYSTKAQKVAYPTTIQEIQNIFKEAYKNNENISIAGVRHFQGGHSNTLNSINIDIKKFNKLISLDTKNKLAKIQSGMTWEQLQDILHPHHLSIAVMQASNIFTIGGSASVNVHGRDPFCGPMIESITLINQNDVIIYADRTTNSELFSQDIINICFDCNGTFYLPYQRFATQKQLLQGYPMLLKFIQKKKQYDPTAFFNSNWHQDYLLPTIDKAS